MLSGSDRSRWRAAEHLGLSDLCSGSLYPNACTASGAPHRQKRLQVDAPPPPPKQDKAALLCALYGYLGARIDSVGRRSSLLMAFLASFLGFALSPLMRTSDTSVSEKLQFTLSHPSLAVGIAGMIVLLWSELARVRRADDLFTKIAFSDVEIGPLQDQFVTSTIDPLFKEMIANTRIVGGFLRRKVKMYNAGAVLFVVSVTLYALGF
jgi:hypothetical protein